MKKLIPIFVVGVLVLSGLGAVALDSDIEKLDLETRDYEKPSSSTSPRDYTHTVFVEWGSACFCGPCASWSSNIWNVYNSGQYDFEYVTMIVYGHGGWGDILNTKANSWKNLYGFTSYPTNIMDGDYRRQTNQPSAFPGNLNACGNRAVHDLDGTLTVTWQGDAVLDIDIEIENNEGSAYSGYIRVPITEIDSRYTNAYSQKYHFGFLDYPFPMNKAITIPAGGTYTDSVTWDGSQHKDNHGDYFDDIDPENIQVFLGVYNNANGYLDETVAALVQENQAPNKPIITGPTTGDPGVEYEYTFVATDPDGDDIYYYVDWGDGTTDGWLGTFESGEEIIVPHTFDEAGIFEITAKARDIIGDEGEWSDPYEVMMGNVAPSLPLISGPTAGQAGTAYDFTFTSEDPNGDDVHYYIKWGDGDTTPWTTLQASGTPYAESHTWDDKGTFTIEAKAKDEHGAESDWESFEIVITKSRVVQNTFIYRLLEQFKTRFPMLNYLLRI